MWNLLYIGKIIAWWNWCKPMDNHVMIVPRLSWLLTSLLQVASTMPWAFYSTSKTLYIHLRLWVSNWHWHTHPYHAVVSSLIAYFALNLFAYSAINYKWWRDYLATIAPLVNGVHAQVRILYTKVFIKWPHLRSFRLWNDVPTGLSFIECFNRKRSIDRGHLWNDGVLRLGHGLVHKMQPFIQEGLVTPPKNP